MLFQSCFLLFVLQRASFSCLFIAACYSVLQGQSIWALNCMTPKGVRGKRQASPCVWTPAEGHNVLEEVDADGSKGGCC